MNAGKARQAVSTVVLGGLLTFSATAADLPYTGDGHMMIEPEALEWGGVGSMPEGAEIAVIEGDPSAEEPFTFRLRFPPEYQFAPHVHPEYERVTVISGTLYFGHGEVFDRDAVRRLPEGSVAIMAPGEPMYGYTTNQETVIQLHGTGPWGIEYVNPADDPRR